MKLIIWLFVIISAIACQSPKEKEEKAADDIIKEVRAKVMVDSFMKEGMKNRLFDTVGLYQSPVKVVSARLIKKDYSNYKDISITFKNVSKKRIEGIRFRWYGLNAFGEPADMGSYGLTEGFGAGFVDEALGSGKSRSSEWSILSKDGKKIVLAWPYEVVFADGTKWKCGE